MNKTLDLTNGNLLKKIIIFSIPIMISGILQLLFNACDLIVVGKFSGDHSLAAVGATSSISGLIINFFIGISVGADATIAQSIGRKDYDKCEKLVHTAISFSVIAGIIITILGLLTSRQLLEYIDTTEDIIDDADLYLKIIFSGSVFNMIYNFGAAILRAIGETKKPLFYLIIAGCINVILNLILVIFFNMDVAGVAIATVASQIISAILIIINLMKRTDFIKFSIKKIQLNLKATLEIIYVGLPAGIQTSLFCISNVLIQSSINSFGSSTIIAGNTASQSIEGFVSTIIGASSNACLTFTSQNYGAKKPDNIKKIFKYSIYWVLISGISLGIIVPLCGEWLLRIYTDGSEAISYGKTRLFYIAGTNFICGLLNVIVSAIRGLGKSIFPTIVTIVGICGFRILWIYTVFEKFHTLDVLYLSYPASWIITGLIQMIIYIIVFRNFKKSLYI